MLTNGGGKHESDRVAELSEKLEIPLDTSMFVQSHTPFAGLDHYKDKTVLVCGGDEGKCRDVAEKYVIHTSLRYSLGSRQVNRTAGTATRRW